MGDLMWDPNGFESWAKTHLSVCLETMAVEEGEPDPPPILITVGTRGETGLFLLPNFSEIEKSSDRAEFMHQLGVKMAQEKLRVCAVAFACFAWASHWPETDCPPFRPPAEDRDREEILSFTAASITGKCLSAAIRTGRDNVSPEEKATNFSPPSDEDICLYDREDPKQKNYLLDAFWEGFCLSTIERFIRERSS